MISEKQFEDYLAALLEGDRRACADAVTGLLDEGAPVKVIYEELFQRSMYRIGEMWEFSQISVSVEHIATAITESLLSLVYPRLFASPRSGLKAVISCVANEHHQIGGKMVADALELRGWDAYFLGADTPTEGLLHILDAKKPAFIGLSLAAQISYENLLAALEQIRGDFPNLPILVGGQAFRQGGIETVTRIRDVVYAAGLDDMESYIQTRFHP